MNSKTHAPYNFVPFAEKPVCRYADPVDLPRHDEWDRNLLSGSIRVTVTAETPVFIGNSDKENADFFRDASGRYAIPGSSFRGLIRQNMQILGFGFVRTEEDYNDYRLMYRQFAAAGRSLAAGLKADYQAMLGIRDGVPRNVGAGYLRVSGGQYSIAPLLGQVISVSRKAPEAQPWQNKWAFAEPVFYSWDGRNVTQLSQTTFDGARYGMLVGTGRMNGQNHLYLFPEECSETVIPLTEADVVAYQEDFETKRNTLGDASDFWALPEEEDKKSGTAGESEELTALGKPVFYLQMGGTTSFGVSKLFRVMYKYGIRDGMPQAHQQADNAETPVIDYPYAIMGFARKEYSYHSRVTVENLRANGHPETEQPFHAILNSPKLSFYPGYIKGGKHYNTDKFRFRGYKQYWLKSALKEGVKESNVTSPLRPLPTGTSFTGTIHYRNLHKDELGLLLWCMALEPDCYQHIGKGKPYGFGRVSVKIDALWEHNPDQLYGRGHLTAGETSITNPKDRVNELIREYKEKIKALLGLDGDILDEPGIKDFFYMKKPFKYDLNEASYMGLSDYKNLAVPLPTVEDFRAGALVQSGQVQAGDVVQGRVNRIVEFGFFVNLSPGESGLVHISQIANRYVAANDIGNYVRVGETVRVKVLGRDEKGRLKLSMKQA